MVVGRDRRKRSTSQSIGDLPMRAAHSRPVLDLERAQRLFQRSFERPVDSHDFAVALICVPSVRRPPRICRTAKRDFQTTCGAAERGGVFFVTLRSRAGRFPIAIRRDARDRITVAFKRADFARRRFTSITSLGTCSSDRSWAGYPIERERDVAAALARSARSPHAAERSILFLR